MKSFSEKCANLNEANKFCVTLSRLAFRNGKLEDLRFLKEKGADISVGDN